MLVVTFGRSFWFIYRWIYWVLSDMRVEGAAVEVSSMFGGKVV